MNTEAYINKYWAGGGGGGGGVINFKSRSLTKGALSINGGRGLILNI